MASASSEASGLQARLSGCRRVGLTCFGVALGTGVAFGLGLPTAVVVADVVAPAEVLAEAVARGRPELMGSMTAPPLGRATAAIVPSGVIAIGPSSGPSLSGKG